ncbi:hypothetical protein HL667_33590 [Bradyrhizobium sp. 83012]|uniref:Uncharacterized protein n=1 Tax=Bradyrhizobium aeschynomenes TaxID=2734909 RepID=A0ABX2CRC1_9BRAD|nr:hypothetical protein [Bradyrhizobium aeschynomenes]NPU69965.1 hypothetical protein [Bradyrhizobium aeschynomenes]
MNDDDDIGPINGHVRSEALPVGCFALVLAAIGVIAALGLYGAWANWMAGR